MTDPLAPSALPARGLEAAAAALAALDERGWRVATAESCTGGLVSALLTAVPGSSRHVLGGIVAYTSDVKSALLGVAPGLMTSHGAVSEAVAMAMARGGRSRLGADVAVAVTGIAGPEGGSPDAPVGRVWIGIATADAARATRYDFAGDRDAVRHAAAVAALDAIRGAANAR